MTDNPETHHLEVVDGVVDDRLLSLFFPAWNEEAGIARTIAASVDVGQALIADGAITAFEVVVVDDASTDETPLILDKLAVDDQRIRIVHHAANRGLGGAIRTGLAECHGSMVLYTDADLPFDLHEIGKAIRLMDRYDAGIVSAFRHDRTGEGPRRFVYSYVYNTLVHSILGLRVRDVNFAAKLIRRDVIDAVELHSTGSFIDVELLAKADRLGFRIVQCGVDYFPRTRGVSTLSSPKVILEMIRELRQLIPEIRASGARTRPS